MERGPIVTKPDNIKSLIYTELGYRIADGRLYQIAGEAEDEYDEALGVDFTAPLYLEGGRFPYPVDVALHKVLAVANRLNRNLKTPLMATDSGWSEGKVVLNKPTDVSEIIDWWLSRQSQKIYSLTGRASLNLNSGVVGLDLFVLSLGRVNPRLEEILSTNSRLPKYGIGRYSGGLSLQKALELRIVINDGWIRWRIIDLGKYSISKIPSIPTEVPLTNNGQVTAFGELSVDSVNMLALNGLLFGVEP